MTATVRSQDRVYRAVVDFHQANGYPPAVRDLAGVTGLGVSTVAYHLDVLCAAGRVTRRPGRARTVTATPPQPAPA